MSFDIAHEGHTLADSVSDEEWLEVRVASVMYDLCVTTCTVATGN